MKPYSITSWRSRIRQAAVILLLLCSTALLAWLGNRYHASYDWTQNQRNSLSEASREILHTLEGPVRIQAYVPADHTLRENIRRLVAKYRQHHAQTTLEFFNPADVPHLVEKLDIHPAGELVIEYAGQQGKLRTLNEQHLSSALLTLSHSNDTWLAFLEGHGERHIHRQGNRDLSSFARQLQRRGIHTQSLDLSETGVIPDNTDILVIADPRTPFSANEVALIRDYVSNGGNLFWLQDDAEQPPEPIGLAGLARELGITFLPGMVVSANTPQLGVKNPGVIIVEQYAQAHDITRELAQRTVFPFCTGLEITAGTGWDASPLIQSSTSSWTETGDLDTPPLRFDENSNERRGPVTLAVALSREQTGQQTTQRIVVSGDADFISNAIVANGANQLLGNNLVYWLAHQDHFIQIQPPQAQDLVLTINDLQLSLYAFGFPFVLPALLLGAGAVIYRRRQRY